MKSEIKLKDIEKIQIYVAKRQKTVVDIKKETGADYILNGGLFDMNYKDKPNLWLRVNGVTLSIAPDTTGNGKPDGFWCYGWDVNNIKIIHSDNINSVKNAICCTTMIKDKIKTKMSYDSAQGGIRGRSAIGLTTDSLVLFCSKDSTSLAMTPEKLQEYMYGLGCKDAIMLDSGGSSSCNFNGSTITTTRKCHNYILVYLKKETNSATSTPTSSTTDSKIGKYTVKATTLNIRSGAGTSYNKVGSYTLGEIIDIAAIVNGWGKTNKGYVSMEYVSFISSDSAKTTNDTGNYIVNATSLNIRSGAGTNFTRVGSYTKGDKVSITSISNGWGKTNKGWVSMSYLTKVTMASSDATSTADNLREKLIAYAKTQLGQNEANNGDDVYIKWYNSVMNCNFALTVSWCSIFVSYCARQVGIPTTQILTTASCTSAMTWFKSKGTWKDAHASYIPKLGDLIYFNTDGNDSNVEHVGMVENQDGTYVYTIEGNSSDSVKENKYLLTNIKVFGYVDWDNSGSGTSVNNTGTVKIGTVTASALNVRTEANTTSKIVKSLPKGSKITILSTSGKWYKIADGYVYSTYVKLD